MINRRNVLKLGAAAMTGAFASGPGATYGAGRTRHRDSLFRGVFDERFPDCVAFADRLEGRGVVTTAVRGDVAHVWYDDLRARLRVEPAPIAGLTDRAALFCLEELARDAGMHVAIRVDHLIDHGGYAHHDAIGPVSLAEATRALDCRTGFGPMMAVLASECARRGARDINAQKRTGPWAPADMTALVTWVIA